MIHLKVDKTCDMSLGSFLHNCEFKLFLFQSLSLVLHSFVTSQKYENKIYMKVKKHFANIWGPLYNYAPTQLDVDALVRAYPIISKVLQNKHYIFHKSFSPTHTFPYWDNLKLPFQIWPVLRPGIQSWYIERLWKLIWVKNILKVIGEVGMDFTISVFVEILIEFGKYWIRNQSK